jgi:hypothetical protein
MSWASTATLEDLQVIHPDVGPNLLQRLGIDVGQLASICFLLFALYQLGQYLYV